jgi:branched-chain amino acid transport system permease protein
MIGKYKAQLALLVAIAASFGFSLCSSQIDDYFLDIMLNVGINIILAVSLNLVNGHTGQFSLGHAGFMAVGAYGSAIVTLEMGARLAPLGAGPAFFIALLTGGVCAAVCGWLVGVPSLRLRGDYLAIVTLGFNEIIRVVLQNTSPEGTFGGALGLKNIPTTTTFFWVFSIASIATYVVTSMVHSTWGRGFLAVRDDEIAASAMGVPTTKFKVTAFVTAAFFAGLGGGLYAHLRSTISPEGFNFLKSIDIVVIVILGGMGSTLGVIVAAIVLTVLNERLRDFEQYRMIVFSLLLIVMMILRPQGLLPAGLFMKKGKSS